MTPRLLFCAWALWVSSASFDAKAGWSSFAVWDYYETKVECNTVGAREAKKVLEYRMQVWKCLPVGVQP